MIALTATEQMRWTLANHYFDMAAKVSAEHRAMVCELVAWVFDNWDDARVRRVYLDLLVETAGPEL